MKCLGARMLSWEPGISRVAPGARCWTRAPGRRGSGVHLGVFVDALAVSSGSGGGGGLGGGIFKRVGLATLRLPVIDVPVIMQVEFQQSMMYVWMMPQIQFIDRVL